MTTVNILAQSLVLTHDIVHVNHFNRSDHEVIAVFSRRGELSLFRNNVKLVSSDEIEQIEPTTLNLPTLFVPASENSEKDDVCVLYSNLSSSRLVPNESEDVEMTLELHYRELSVVVEILADLTQVRIRPNSIVQSLSQSPRCVQTWLNGLFPAHIGHDGFMYIEGNQVAFRKTRHGEDIMTERSYEATPEELENSKVKSFASSKMLACFAILRFNKVKQINELLIGSCYDGYFRSLEIGSLPIDESTQMTVRLCPTSGADQIIIVISDLKTVLVLPFPNLRLL